MAEEPPPKRSGREAAPDGCPAGAIVPGEGGDEAAVVLVPTDPAVGGSFASERADAAAAHIAAAVAEAGIGICAVRSLSPARGGPEATAAAGAGRREEDVRGAADASRAEGASDYAGPGGGTTANAAEEEREGTEASVSPRDRARGRRGGSRAHQVASASSGAGRSREGDGGAIVKSDASKPSRGDGEKRSAYGPGPDGIDLFEPPEPPDVSEAGAGPPARGPAPAASGSGPAPPDGEGAGSPPIPRPGAEHVEGRAPGQMPAWLRRLPRQAAVSARAASRALFRTPSGSTAEETHVTDAELAPDEPIPPERRDEMMAIAENSEVFVGVPSPEDEGEEGGRTRTRRGCHLPRKRGMACWARVAAVAVLAGVIMGVALGPVLSNNDDAGSMEGQQSHRLVSIRAALGSFTRTDSLDDPASPQHRALVWLADEDERKVSTEDLFYLTQRFAVAVIFFSTGGEQTWSTRSKFLSPDHECGWNEEVPEYRLKREDFPSSADLSLFEINYTAKGIFCLSDNITVGRILVPRNNLTGTLPSEIGLLAGLRNLELWRNNLAGTIPPSIENLTELESINLGFNDLTGAIPSTFSKLSHLRGLLLFENHLSGTVPSLIAHLVGLEILSIGVNKFTGTIPGSLGQLSSLAHLFLAYNKLTGTIPPSLNNNRNLHMLFLANNQLHGTLPFAAGSFPKLQHLYLGGNQLDGTVPKTLMTYDNLAHLVLYENNLTGTLPSGFENLTRLEWVDLSENNLQGSISQFVADIATGSNRTLETLHLANNNFTGTLPKSIGDFTNLNKLILDRNRLDGTLPHTLGNLLKLEWLTLSSNYFTGRVPHGLSRLHSLSVLGLGNNNFTGDLDFFCNQTFSVFMADCHDVDPEVVCGCCNACCLDSDPGGDMFGCFPIR